MNDLECFDLGDPRRCPVHPEVITSSPDGAFDAPCGKCENEKEAQREADFRDFAGFDGWGWTRCPENISGCACQAQMDLGPAENPMNTDDIPF